MTWYLFFYDVILGFTGNHVDMQVFLTWLAALSIMLARQKQLHHLLCVQSQKVSPPRKDVLTFQTTFLQVQNMTFLQVRSTGNFMKGKYMKSLVIPYINFSVNGYFGGVKSVSHSRLKCIYGTC